MVFTCDALPWGLYTGLQIQQLGHESTMNKLKSIQKKKFDFLILNLFNINVERTGQIDDFIDFSQIKAGIIIFINGINILDLELESSKLESIGIRLSNMELINGEQEQINKRLDQIKQEVDFASYLGVNNVVLFVNTKYDQNNFDKVVDTYANFIKKIITKQTDVQIWLQFDISFQETECDPWKIYNQIRLRNSRNYRLSLHVTSNLPSINDQRRWLAENVKNIHLLDNLFIINKKGFPTIPQTHEKFIISFFKYQVSVTFELSDQNQDHLSLVEHRNFICYLYKTQPKISEDEIVASSYYDVLQDPLQPYKDNLHSSTYEVFENDPIKYEKYEYAVLQYFEDRKQLQKDKFIVVLAGAGRGGILFRIVSAAVKAKVQMRCIAVEKNPYAYLTLKYLQSKQKDWRNIVEIVNADLKIYQPEFQADLIVSELLGSFGDNELSPECLIWAQRFLKKDGVSIPFNSTSFLTPVSCPLLHTKVKSQQGIAGYNSSHVVYFHQYYAPLEVKPCFYYQHPDFEEQFKLTTEKIINFNITQDLLIHGFIGYFDSVLYKSVLLSTHPQKHTENMYSWFEIYFPFEQPIQVKNNQILEIKFKRINDSKKVWYEWEGRICNQEIISDDQNEIKQFSLSTIQQIPTHNQNGTYSAIFIE